VLPAGVTLRAGGAGDAELLAGGVLEGFETYRAFAPAGWEPPPRAVELARIRERLPGAWVIVAERGGARVGHVALVPDAAEPGGAYLWHLFVARRWWGTGLAAELHARFVAEARARGCDRARALTPAGQARARRFYEREGWRVDREPFLEPALGLELVVIRRVLVPPGAETLRRSAAACRPA
jgi:GNAT superfamily N-acetyltransferase